MTDFVILEALSLELISATECVLLQPNFDQLQPTGDSRLGPGWQGVRKFLRTAKQGLALPTFDIIIIQIDASIRHLPEVRSNLPAGDEETAEALTSLCNHVKSWSVVSLPETAIIALPREELEAWLVAAHTNLQQVETLEDPAGILADKGIITRKNKKPYKTSERYRELAPALVRLAGDNRRLRQVPELERFIGKLRRRAQVLKRAHREK